MYIYIYTYDTVHIHLLLLLSILLYCHCVLLLYGRSFLVSADCAHGLHPNYTGKHQNEHRPVFSIFCYKIIHETT